MSTPRIIGGTARGIRIKAVPGDTTRPVTDRVKEALFNIIGADIRDTSMLDLFGGTGSIGIEALSRGAAFVRFLDLNRSAVAIIKENLELTRLQTKGEVRQADSLAYLRQSADRKFEYIYIAPPQYKGLWLEAINILDNNPAWLTPDAWVIIQIHPKEYQSVTFHNFEEFDRRNYGSTLLVFLERKSEEII
jgi:16S rRNA (guanine966-N2)-methyltransferase